MAEEVKPTVQQSKSGTESAAIKGLSVPPPSPVLTQLIVEGQRVPSPPPQVTQERMGQPVPLPAPALLQPAVTAQPAAPPSGGQPASSGQSPQCAPPAASTAPNTGGGNG